MQLFPLGLEPKVMQILKKKKKSFLRIQLSGSLVGGTYSSSIVQLDFISSLAEVMNVVSEVVEILKLEAFDLGQHLFQVNS